MAAFGCPQPAARVKARILERWAIVEALGDSACVVTSTGPWSHTFLVRSRYSAYRSRSSASQSAFISSRSFDLHDDFAAAAPCPPVFVGSRGVFKGEHLRHLDA